jgi:hypothetical protein
MRLTPIFDTSSLINLSREDDLDAAVKRLKPLIPSRGCPLSFVTTLELFRGLSNGDPEKVAETLKPLLLAARISRGVVLRVPIRFASWELFKVAEVLRHRPKLLVDWLERIQTPGFVTKFTSGEVGMDFERIKRVFEKIEQEEHLGTELMLDKWYPGWREERRNGSALPEDLRERVKRDMQFDALKDMMPELFLTQLQIQCTAANIGRVQIHCDAFFTYHASRLRACVLGNYIFEKNPNDFHDWLQLLYLTRPSVCLVTDDRPSLDRTRHSSQRPRIMSLKEFLAGSA